MRGALEKSTIVVLGGGGFVGGHAAGRLAADGYEVRRVAAPRIVAEFGTPPEVAARAWIANHDQTFSDLVTDFRGAPVAVNAAGMATATGKGSPEMWGANAVLPAVIALAASAAGVKRFIHVSSAAVQGSQRTLDERPFAGTAHSPYALAKGAGEAAIAEAKSATTVSVIYRPASVLGVERPIAARLAAVLRSRWLVVPAGEVPLPVAHVDNVARAIAFLADREPVPAIVTHPWEGMTTASLALAFGRARPIRRLPDPIGSMAVRAIRLLSRGGPLAGHARRIELLWDGQQQQSSLPDLGFEVEDPLTKFTELGGQLA